MFQVSSHRRWLLELEPCRGGGRRLRLLGSGRCICRVVLPCVGRTVSVHVATGTSFHPPGSCCGSGVALFGVVAQHRADHVAGLEQHTVVILGAPTKRVRVIHQNYFPRSHVHVTVQLRQTLDIRNQVVKLAETKTHDHGHVSERTIIAVRFTSSQGIAQQKT